jgi:hypothetical protein
MYGKYSTPKREKNKASIAVLPSAAPNDVKSMTPMTSEDMRPSPWRTERNCKRRVIPLFQQL